MSKEYKKYLNKLKLNKLLIILTQISLLLFFIILWQYSADKGWTNTFITSSPKQVVKTFIKIYKDNNLLHHIWVTVYETLISFSLATILGIIIAIILWWNKFLSKVLDPYLTIINSLPKVALGPIIIIWSGANIKSIILMALLISLIITIITVHNGFKSTDQNKINLLKSFKASKLQILKYLILPNSYNTIISSLKINISMALIGVITGEFLVSKEGIGYLIVYGSQVFNLSLVISGIIILLIVSYIMYLLVSKLEKLLIKQD
jgi:NitT/TauT family transport system permease protein